MEIQINKNYKLTSDELNVILCKKVNHKKENAKSACWKNIGYYQKMEHALDRLVDRKIYESGAVSFEALKSELAELRLEVVSAFSQNTTYGSLIELNEEASKEMHRQV